jgi:hypothetical protein
LVAGSRLARALDVRAGQGRRRPLHPPRGQRPTVCQRAESHRSGCRCAAPAECRRAQALASLAQAEAEDERRFETYMRVHAAVMRALDQLQRYRDEQAKLPPAKRAPADDPLLHAMCTSVNAATDWWRANGREWRAGRPG